jgi:hypothetical protein
MRGERRKKKGKARGEREARISEAVYSNQQLKGAYKALSERVLQGINANSVVIYLFSKNVLSDEDNYKFACMAESPDKTRQLMALLHYRGNPNAFTTLHEAIKKETSYSWLVEEIENQCKQLTGTMSAAVESNGKNRQCLRKINLLL